MIHYIKVILTICIIGFLGLSIDMLNFFIENKDYTSIFIIGIINFILIIMLYYFIVHKKYNIFKDN